MEFLIEGSPSRIVNVSCLRNYHLHAMSIFTCFYILLSFRTYHELSPDTHGWTLQRVMLLFDVFWWDILSVILMLVIARCGLLSPRPVQKNVLVGDNVYVSSCDTSNSD